MNEFGAFDEYIANPDNDPRELLGFAINDVPHQPVAYPELQQGVVTTALRCCARFS
jgi:hypothetical protein